MIQDDYREWLQGTLLGINQPNHSANNPIRTRISLRQYSSWTKPQEDKELMIIFH